MLGLYAIATGLSRPELTAGVCTTLALSAAAFAVTTAGWPDSFGPFADRVADSAAGAAAVTLPIAVGTLLRFYSTEWLGAVLTALALALLAALLMRERYALKLS